MGQIPPSDAEGRLQSTAFFLPAQHPNTMVVSLGARLRTTADAMSEHWILNSMRSLFNLQLVCELRAIQELARVN